MTSRRNLTQRRVRFELVVDSLSASSRVVRVAVHVPAHVCEHEAPRGYAGAPPLTRFVACVRATSVDGTELPVQVSEQLIRVDSQACSEDFYCLRYDYAVPQAVPGEVHLSLPSLDATHALFDNHLTFLLPVGVEAAPAELHVSVPEQLPVLTSWGGGAQQLVPTVRALVGGVILVGEHRRYTRQAAGHPVDFALRGDCDDPAILDQVTRILSSQCEIVGSFPAERLLFVVQNGLTESCKGTALTNALVVHVPEQTSFVPANFQAIGTISHELFHQWNALRIMPRSPTAAYLLTEGFTNHFAVASLVHAGLFPPERYARFLVRYRDLLEHNARYPGASFEDVNAGFEQGDDELSSLAYQKGPFVAVLLDRALREDTDGQHSIVTWFRALDAAFGASEGYTIADLRSLTVTLAGGTASRSHAVFEHAMLGPERLDLTELFSWLGIEHQNDEVVLLPLDAVRDVWRRELFSGSG